MKKEFFPYITIIIALFLFLIVQIATAEIIVTKYSVNSGFDVSTSETAEVCACSTVSDSVIITNTGAYTATFQLSKNLDIVTLSNDQFELKSGESKTVHLIINAACDSSGTYQLQLDVLSSAGAAKSIEKKIIIGRCQNLKMMLNASSDTINPCEAVKYDLYVQNVGTFPEEYLIELDQYSQYANFSENKFTLKPNEIKKVDASVRFPCDVFGEKTITFKAKSVQNQLEARISHELTINKNYDFDVSIPQNNTICGFQENRIPLVISNEVAIPNDYEILFDKKLVSLENNKTIHLEAFEKKTVFLLTNMADKKDGKDTTNITVKSLLGKEEKIVSPELNVLTCYLINVDILTDKASLCEEKEYDVVVKNNGIYQEKINLGLEAPDFVSLSEESITLQPGKEQTLKLKIAQPTTDSEYTIKVYAVLENNISASDSMLLQAHSQDTCYYVELKNSNFKIYPDNKNVPLILENTGLRAGSYKLKLEQEPDWITLEERNIELAPGNKTIIHINTEQTNETAKGKYNATLVIKLEDSDVTYTKTVTITLREKSFFLKAYEFFYYNDCNTLSLALFIILLILVILFIIIKKKNLSRYFFNKNKNEIKILYVLTIVFLIIILALIFTTKVPVKIPELNEPNATYHSWLENTKYKVDISKYFYDPDQDILAYSVANQPENIKVKIDKNIVTFIPQHNWYGQREIVFTATDSRGGSVDSPIITLDVAYVEKPSIEKYLQSYCLTINLAILFLIILVIYLIFLLKKTKPGRRKA